jgi:hypothetical protein
METSNETQYPAFGVICWDGGQPQIEVFRLIKEPSDLPNIKSLKLRSRFNSHRRYKYFSMESTEYGFELLNKRLNEDNEAFAEWIELLKLEYFEI